ncbi:RNA-binding S4 domain-containing protein [Rhizobium halophytocola]|uniref:Ribosome-associated heat shock protein Hsp15 n=1 Tax=Rhizobium halophytocola TaxID=735519 RepID=A0ABS4E540_9HYPH|nr:RNA-binding S4 domain-containing protein [Rhizobium halophytocola]MBP1853068.1 ribosome-associated heat shock protein Hsp15 [Rhizobium halophytocola]
MSAEPGVAEDRQRIDKWLFFARILKSRSIAQAHIGSGHVKVNGQTIRQVSRQVSIGDRLEIALRERDLVLVVRGSGSRRGPFSEARLLYEDLTPERPSKPQITTLDQAMREPGSGRPTKKERRAIDGLVPDADGDF